MDRDQSEVTNNNYEGEIEEDKITEEEVRKAIKALKDGKAFGPDGIPNEIIKRCEEELLEPICIVFNKSLNEGSIPEMWRCANVVPIFKKGSKEDPLNYRPVSLTCVLCKMFESIIKKRISKDLNKNNFLIDEQHGFRSGHSTTTNLLEFYNDVIQNLDRKHSVDIMYFDLAKAFDTVPHSKLINKLKAMNLNKKLVTWIEDYLKGRKQRVLVRGKLSEWLEVFSGVPQGSVIGPLLFLIFINDLKEGIQSKLSIFADDTKIMHIVDTEEEIKELEEDLRKLQKWSEMNDMKFNTDKCSVMHCGTNNRKTQYKLYGKILRDTNSEKDLGVIVDKDMKFKSQVAAQTKKANNTLGMIKRNFECVNQEVFQILYSTLVRPNLEYAVQVWNPYQKGEKEKIEKIQRRATKMVRELKDNCYEERLHKLDLMSTETRRERGDQIMCYKILNNKVTVDEHVLIKATETRTRGHSMKLAKTTMASEIRKNFFSNRVVNKWNDLRQETVTASNIESFKEAYDREERIRKGGSTTSSRLTTA